MITLAFRLDDPSETSNQELEAEILDVLYTHRVPCTFAIIPFRIVDEKRISLSLERARPLIAATREGFIEPALHGYVHVRIDSEMIQPSEFSGRSKNEQFVMISEGRAHLESIFDQSVNGFVPPWNSYDKTTVQILEASGFRYISASWRAPKTNKGHIKMLPLTAHLNHLNEAVNEARRFSKANPVIVVVMHHYDFAESRSNMAVTHISDLSDKISWLADQPDIKIRTLTEISESMTSSDTAIRQYRIRNKYSLFSSMLPKHSFLNTTPWRGMLAKPFFS